jgi:hypothetical protein
MHTFIVSIFETVESTIGTSYWVQIKRSDVPEDKGSIFSQIGTITPFKSQIKEDAEIERLMWDNLLNSPTAVDSGFCFTRQMLKENNKNATKVPLSQE